MHKTPKHQLKLIVFLRNKSTCCRNYLNLVVLYLFVKNHTTSLIPANVSIVSLKVLDVTVPCCFHTNSHMKPDKLLTIFGMLYKRRILVQPCLTILYQWKFFEYTRKLEIRSIYWVYTQSNGKYI